jgi:hypothetical protein
MEHTKIKKVKQHASIVRPANTKQDRGKNNANSVLPANTMIKVVGPNAKRLTVKNTPIMTAQPINKHHHQDFKPTRMVLVSYRVQLATTV